MIEIFDKTGYQTPNNAFDNISYSIKNVQRNFDVKRLSNGTTLMDDLLSLDIVRTPRNILQIEYLDMFDLQKINEEIINNDSVIVIGYQLASPAIHLTGDFHANFCEGKLYISTTKNMVLKSEVHLKANQHSPLGRNIVATTEQAYKNTDYHVTTFYKSTLNGYALDKINLNLTYTSGNHEVLENASLQVIKIKTESPVAIEQRQYFEDMISDPDFWLSSKKEE